MRVVVLIIIIYIYSMLYNLFGVIFIVIVLSPCSILGHSILGILKSTYVTLK